MYLSIPDVFFVPIVYIEDDMFTIKKILILPESNSDNDFIKRTDLVVGVSLPVGGGEKRWDNDKAALENYAKDKGITLKVAPNANTAAEQAREVEILISQGIDVLILAPVNLLDAADLVETAHKSGIKVIAYDRLIANTDLDLYVSFDSVRVGELQGQFLIQKVPKGNYIILSGGPTDNNSKLVKEGAMNYIRPLTYIKNINIVTEAAIDNWDTKIAFKIVKDSLIANQNKIDAILAPNDAIAEVVIQALSEQGLAGKIPVTGQDAELAAAQRIVQRTQSMTVLKDFRELSKTAIDAAIKIAKGEDLTITDTVNNNKINVPSILIAPILVDKNNIYDVLINSGYLKQSDVYKM